MLEHLDLPEHARRVRAALLETIAAGTRTADLGGSATTREFARAISERLG
jgi:isocitrate/isopropylmalate dehydrogenase